MRLITIEAIVCRAAFVINRDPENFVSDIAGQRDTVPNECIEPAVVECELTTRLPPNS